MRGLELLADIKLEVNNHHYFSTFSFHCTFNPMYKYFYFWLA